jgi:protein phosphatase
MTLPLRTYATTHVGHHHPRNEDAHAIVPLDQGRAVLLVVCDGMGGMGRGDEASRIALASIEASMTAVDAGLPPDRMRDALRKADVEVRNALCTGIDGMPGSTAVLVYVTEGAAHVAWVGDSRAYLVRDGAIVDRTRDHKLVDELVEAGQITHDEAKTSAFAHVVTRALGGRPVHEPQVHPAQLGYPWKLRTGDRILVCTDGITDLVTDPELPNLLASQPPAEAAEALVRIALDRGGHDNITCIVAAWDGPSFEDEEGRVAPIGAIGGTLPPRDEDPAEVTFEFAPGRQTADLDRGDLAPAPTPRRVAPWIWALLVAAVILLVAWLTADR